jgi:hypothetical protein
MAASGYTWKEARALVFKLFRMPKQARVQAKALEKKKSWEKEELARWEKKSV